MKLSCHDLRLKQGAFSLEIDFEASGHVIGVFGSSGAGKTTLLEVIAGLRRLDSGRIGVDERALTDVPRHKFLPPEHRGMGYIPQDIALFPHLSVRKNLLYGTRDPGDRITFEHVITVLELESLLERAVPELSGGQQQRVAFARALLSSPRLLLMDEPLASLDHEIKLRIIPYLQCIRDEFRIPMIYVSHTPDEIAALCDRVVVLRDGKCLCTATPAELFETTAAMKLRAGIYDSAK